MSESENIKSVPSALQFEQGGDDEIEIDLVDLFYMLLGHWWQILLSILVCGTIAFAVTRFYITPLYTASSRLYILSASNNSIVNLADLQIGSSLTADYQELIYSRPLLESVIENLDLDTDYDSLSSVISVTNVTDTRILTITATTASPRMSADIANEVARQAIIYLPDIMETATPHLVESAVVPTTRSSPSYTRNLIIGMMIGALLSCGVLLVIYLTNDTFTTPDDVTKYLGIQPLATIPEKNLGDFNDGKGLHRNMQAKQRGKQSDEKTGTESNA